jgi:hypothetical protein
MMDIDLTVIPEHPDLFLQFLLPVTNGARLPKAPRFFRDKS